MVYLGTPTYSGDLHWTTVAGMVNTATYCSKNKIGFAMDVIPGDAFIGKARNIIVHRFLKSGFRDLLFIDADVGFKAEAVADICKAVPQIVMGLYKMKQEKPKYPALMFDPLERHPSDRRLIRLQYGPAGFLRIRREVFEAMIKKWPNDFYFNSLEEKVYDFFPHGREGNHFYGEDLQFCRRAQELGFDIWAMQDIALEHTGNKTWESNWAVDVAQIDEHAHGNIAMGMEPA